MLLLQKNNKSPAFRKRQRVIFIWVGQLDLLLSRCFYEGRCVAAVSAAIAAAAKKVLVLLAGNKNGRKFLGYVVGITLFIILLPLITVVGLFGWLSGGSGMEMQNTVAQQLQAQYAEQYPQHAQALEQISVVFGIFGIGDQAGLAQAIYISSDLPSKNTDDSFYTTYANCFLVVTAENSLTDCITEIFGIEFTDQDKADIAAWSQRK